MAGAASCRNVGVMDLGFGIAGGEQLVRTAVTIDARRSLGVPTLHCFAVKAAIVCGLFVGVTRRASDFLRSSFVRGAGYIRMAIHAGEHAAVDGVFELLRIDLQADRFAIDFVGQASITVARQAFIHCRFGRFFF